MSGKHNKEGLEVSNADVCPSCYPLMTGAQTMCREHLLEDAFRPFAEACKRYEKNGGDFAKAFHSVSVADIRRAAAIKLSQQG